MEISAEAIVSIIGLVMAIPSAVFAVWSWRRYQTSAKRDLWATCTCRDSQLQQFQDIPSQRALRSRRYPQSLSAALNTRGGLVGSTSRVHVDMVGMIWSPRDCHWDCELGQAAFSRDSRSCDGHEGGHRV
jgi:hypothetical protein